MLACIPNENGRVGSDWLVGRWVCEKWVVGLVGWWVCGWVKGRKMGEWWVGGWVDERWLVEMNG